MQRIEPAMIEANACILISSCEKYRHLAAWTADRIDRMWENHPRLYFSGLSAPNPRHLPCEGDPRDWMTVTLKAVQALIQEGFSQVYLILDDIPPVGRCQADFLNRILPGAAAQAGASLVSLLGWGQHRALEGDRQTVNGLPLERLPAANRWRFSLHPGLWNLTDLRDILNLRCEQFPPNQRTPWNFERHHDRDFAELPGRILNSCYRIHGRSHVSEDAPWLTDLLQGGGCFTIDVALFLIRKTRGDAARADAAARWLWPYCLYRGPYPIFWSGVMRQGAESREWKEFTRSLPWKAVSREWNTQRPRLIS